MNVYEEFVVVNEATVNFRARRQEAEGDGGGGGGGRR